MKFTTKTVYFFGFFSFIITIITYFELHSYVEFMYKTFYFYTKLLLLSLIFLFFIFKEFLMKKLSIKSNYLDVIYGALSWETAKIFDRIFIIIVFLFLLLISVYIGFCIGLQISSVIRRYHLF